MLVRLKHYSLLLLVLLLAFLLLLSCVSISETNQAFSSSTNISSIYPDAGTELQSCQQPVVLSRALNTASGLNPENIHFLNWNLYKGDGENWQQDLSMFAKTHQLMTIQEVKLSDELTELLAQYKFNWIMNAAFYLNGDASGVMNAGRSDAVYSCGFKSKEPIIRIPKSTLISYYTINGSDKKLLLANIHGINFTLGTTSYRQQLQQLYQAIKHHDGPMIVAGDFNSWSDDRMAEVHDVVRQLSLSELEYSVNNKTHVFGMAIDHVFYRGLDVVSHQVQQVSSSDHNPISVNFRLSAETL